MRFQALLDLILRNQLWIWWVFFFIFYWFFSLVASILFVYSVSSVFVLALCFILDYIWNHVKTKKKKSWVCLWEIFLISWCEKTHSNSRLQCLVGTYIKAQGKGKLLRLFCLTSLLLRHSYILFLKPTLTGMTTYFFRILTVTKHRQLFRISVGFQHQVGPVEITILRYLDLWLFIRRHPLIHCSIQTTA